MNVTVYNTGFDADGIPSGGRKAMPADEAHALCEKWGGMMKVEAHAEPEAEAQAPEPRAAAPRARPARAARKAK